jgi:D-alanine--poly(phosphoribitol) ligase subunit 1
MSGEQAGATDCQHDLNSAVLRSAARHPDRTALWVEGCAVTYRELVANAAALAKPLGDLDCASAARCCAILGARSLSAFTGILGTLFARFTYVPMNPRHPVERLLGAFAASESVALVVDRNCEQLAQPLLSQIPRSVVVLMPEYAAVPDWAAGLPRHRFLCRHDLVPDNVDYVTAADPNDGAYLLFTSGSTGVPKGVLVRHRNAAAYIRGALARYMPQPSDRFSQLFDLTFDLSVHDMFLCWTAGAALYCPPANLKIAPHDFVRRHALTFWFSVPSVAGFMQRLHLLRPGDFPSLRWSLFCGEALPKRLAHAWAEVAPNSVIENLYGPTEATIAITAYRVPSDPASLARLPDIVPIGLPLPGQQAIVVDRDGSPVAAGEAGELCLGGSQVTDGYLARPDLTAERFVPPAVARKDDTKWYRTGDRARLDPEHGLLFLGRMDRQVKIAGYRIELQEVEEALRRAAGCDTVAAIAWPLDADGLPRGITAFLPEEIHFDGVAEGCRRLLPPYMMPASFRHVAEWPVNDNGKTDYKRLQQMVEEQPCPTMR